MTREAAAGRGLSGRCQLHQFLSGSEYVLTERRVTFHCLQDVVDEFLERRLAMIYDP